MEKKNLKWKGNDVSLMECVENYGMVYTYDGEDFNGWCADGFDEDGVPNSFAPFWLDNNIIDDYFNDEGVAIAKMCGTTQDKMDYEWKMEALFCYYGSHEFVSGMYKPISKDELIAIIKDNWFGH